MGTNREEKGLDNKNTDDEPSNIESSEARVGAPAIVQRNESNSDLNNSIDHTEQMDEEEDTIHHRKTTSMEDDLNGR